MAVGWTVASPTSGALPFAQTWDGTSWSVRPVLDPPEAPQAQLEGVSCTSASFCMAVGAATAHSGSSGDTLAETWNGSTWAISPTGDGITNGGFMSVSCASAATCIAVGIDAGANTALAERWSGGAWSTQPVPVPAGATAFPELISVSCPSAAVCTAVGRYPQSPQTQPLFERWDGARWTEQPAPVAPSGSLPAAVSCPTAGNCTAVDLGPGAAAQPTPEAETWSRTSGWTVEPMAAPPEKTVYLQMNAVSCVSVTTCAATGFRDARKPWFIGHPLVEHE
jgi:hypothetical protein